MVRKMVKKKIIQKPNNERDERVYLLDAALAFDETCSRILRVLLEDRFRRFSEIKNQITKMYGKELTHRVLSKHLKH